MNAVPSHDNDWTVRTLKEHYDALRTEDQKAVVLLSRDLATRLDRITIGFDELKTSVDRFHSAVTAQQARGKWDFGVVINLITLLFSGGVLATIIFGHR